MTPRDARTPRDNRYREEVERQGARPKSPSQDNRYRGETERQGTKPKSPPRDPRYREEIDRLGPGPRSPPRGRDRDTRIGRDRGRSPENPKVKSPERKKVSLPKTFKYDGRSNWQAFFAKFSRYAQVIEWSEAECRDQLCWCLEGKASEYYALLVDRQNLIEETGLLNQ